MLQKTHHCHPILFYLSFCPWKALIKMISCFLMSCIFKNQDVLQHFSGTLLSFVSCVQIDPDAFLIHSNSLWNLHIVRPVHMLLEIGHHPVSDGGNWCQPACPDVISSSLTNSSLLIQQLSCFCLVLKRKTAGRAQWNDVSPGGSELHSSDIFWLHFREGIL